MLWILLIPVVAGLFAAGNALWYHLAVRSKVNTYVEHKDYWGSPYKTEYTKRQHREAVSRCANNGALLGFIVGVLAAVVLNMYFHSSNRIPEDRYTTLYALNDALGVQGRSYFLGSGYIETSPVYTYYWKDGESYRLAWQRSSNSKVTYSDSTPKLIHHGSRQGYSNWFSIGADDWKVDLYDRDAYEFLVPSGSIAQNFNLDAQ